MKFLRGLFWPASMFILVCMTWITFMSFQGGIFYSIGYYNSVVKIGKDSFDIRGSELRAFACRGGVQLTWEPNSHMDHNGYGIDYKVGQIETHLNLNDCYEYPYDLNDPTGLDSFNYLPTTGFRWFGFEYVETPIYRTVVFPYSLVIVPWWYFVLRRAGRSVASIRKNFRIERGLCTHCAYDLKGLRGETTVCPECGSKLATM